MVDNADWLDALEYIPFLREIGQHFSINRMLSFDSRQAPARPRAVADLPRIQLHDPPGLRFPRAVACAPAAGCRWADRTSGAISSTASSWRAGWTAPRSSALTTPLITTADGGKMGKTEKGAVWLNADQLGPYDYWQFWRNTQDARRRPLPAPVHRPAARRDRAAGGAARAPRSTTPRRRWPTPRRRCCTATMRRPRRGRDRAQDLRGRRGRRGPADAEGRRRDRPGRCAGRPRPRRLEERGAAADRAGRRPGRRRDGRGEDVVIAVAGEVRISAGKKKHGLLVPTEASP